VRHLRILDCACGIGTQALGLAARGHQVTGTDLSAAAIARASREAAARNLTIAFSAADMRNLSAVPASGFDAVLAADNALPHLLSTEDLKQALDSISGRLSPGGILLASIRDYDHILAERPNVDLPRFFWDGKRRRIVHQVWDWHDDNTYTLHLYITRESEWDWECLHFVSVYRAWRRGELSAVLENAGFRTRWLMPPESGFFQPIVMARSGHRD
jgi:SAM-dependent methyltransferase